MSALRRYGQQLAEARESGSSIAISAPLLGLGNVEEGQGRYADALQSYEQAVAMYQHFVIATTRRRPA